MSSTGNHPDPVEAEIERALDPGFVSDRWPSGVADLESEPAGRIATKSSSLCSTAD